MAFVSLPLVGIFVIGIINRLESVGFVVVQAADGYFAPGSAGIDILSIAPNVQAISFLPPLSKTASASEMTQYKDQFLTNRDKHFSLFSRFQCERGDPLFLNPEVWKLFLNSFGLEVVPDNASRSLPDIGEFKINSPRFDIWLVHGGHLSSPMDRNSSDYDPRSHSSKKRLLRNACHACGFHRLPSNSQKSQGNNPDGYALRPCQEYLPARRFIGGAMSFIAALGAIRDGIRCNLRGRGLFVAFLIGTFAAMLITTGYEYHCDDHSDGDHRENDSILDHPEILPVKSRRPKHIGIHSRQAAYNAGGVSSWISN
jgi:hypothetical protein